MFIFRSSFIVAAFACVIALISQCTTVLAAPQLGMRPYLHVYGVDASGPIVPTILSSSAAAAIESAAIASHSAAESVTATVDTATEPTDIPGDTTEATVQSNGALPTSAGLSVALFVGSVAAVLQII